MRKVVGFLRMLMKPLMNQRGEIGEQVDPHAVPLDENGFIAGTNYKTVQDLVKGHGELKGKFDAQGNELGQTRTQAQTLMEAVKELTGKGGQAAKPAEDPSAPYEAKAAEVQKQIEDLDPMDDNFSKKQASLIKELTSLTAQAQHEKTLGASQQFIKDELTKRDSAAAQKMFFDENPSFKTPDMQARIKDFLANDKTGMHDAMSAFFKLQSDDLKSLGEENAELKKILELQRGKDSTGKVITKGQPAGVPPKQPRAAGQEADAGAIAALLAARG